MSTKKLSLLLVAAIGALVLYAWMHTSPWTSIAAPPEGLPVGVAHDEGSIEAVRASTGGLKRGSPEPGEEDQEAASVLLEQGHLDEAIDALERSVAAAPRRAGAWSDLANASLKRGAADLERALVAAERATELEPDLWQAWYNLACVRARRGETDAALESLGRAHELTPGGIAETAREDPDLEALRGQPRFQELVRPR